LRTPCIAFTPDVIRSYPLKVVDRATCCAFEHGPQNFSLWARESGFSSKLVTIDGEHDFQDWRKPDNIFRRGNQSNCLVRDRHPDVWDASGEDEKKAFSLQADGVK
jgi:hypothetical protein